MIRLVTGGIRSGKSKYAEELVQQLGSRVCYVATGVITDKEMENRVKRHQQRRPKNWMVLEESVCLAEGVKQVTEPILLIDCLSTWTTNRLMELSPEQTDADRGEFEQKMGEEAKELVQALQGKEAVIVTSETGLGGIQVSKIGRMFQDALGTVNQNVAASADEVWMTVAGVPWRVKG